MRTAHEVLLGLGAPRRIKAILGVSAATCVAAAAAYFLIAGVVAGSKTYIGLGLSFVLLPGAVYLALTRPLIFPFCLYSVLVPIDNALGVSKFGTLTKIVGIIVAGCLLLWLLRHRTMAPVSRAQLWWIAFLIWLGCSVFWAIDTRDAVTSLITYASVIGLYLVIAAMPVEETDFHYFLASVICGGLLAAAYSIHQYAAAGPNAVHESVQLGQESLDPNQLAAALLLPVSVAFALLMRSRNLIAKIMVGGALLILLDAVRLTASRGGVLALGLLLVYFLVRGRQRLWSGVLVSLIGIASLLSGQAMWSRFSNAVSSGGSGRISIWRVGWDAFKSHWLIGAGVGSFPTAYDRSFLKVFEPISTTWHRASHNTVLTLAVELGCVGLVVAGTAWYTEWRSLSCITREDPLFDIRIAIEAALVAMFVDALFLEIMYDKFVWLVFIAAAMIRSCAKCRASGAAPLVYLDRRKLRSDADFAAGNDSMLATL
jgi:O-antigen ligase